MIFRQFIFPHLCSVDTYKDEFCSRNVVIFAHTLFQGYEVTTKPAKKNYGHHLIEEEAD